jgi:HK97 family phage portal protein
MIKQAYENAASLLWLPEQELKEQIQKRSWQGFDLDPSRSQRNPSGIRITPDTALHSTTVLACVRVLGESVASLPCNLYKKTKDGGKELATSHPLFEVLHSTPNSWQTSYEFFEQMMLHVTLHGNAYSYIKSGKKGFATELIPLHPTRVQVERLENGRLRYTYTQERGKQVVYSQDKIVHLRWLSDDGVTGMVPVQLSQDAIALSRACEIHGSAFFGNGAMPGICLETDQVLDQSSATALRENWERMHRSSNNAFRTAVLMGGLKAHELGSSNSDSQFLETRRMQVEEICRIFRCPPHLVGDLSRSSFSNIEQQSIDFLQHTLQPWLTRIQACLGRDVVIDNDLFVEFDPRQLLRGDVSARASYYTTMWNLGVTSINELRAWESLNPIPDGDNRFIQLNMQTLDQANAKGDAEVAQTEQMQELLTEEGINGDGGESSDPPGEGNVADVSMSGQQITGLLTILEQYSGGLIGEKAAKALIKASFPSIPDSYVEEVVADTNEKPEEEAGPGLPQEQGAMVDPFTGEPMEEDQYEVVNGSPEEDEEVDDEAAAEELSEESRNCGTGALGGKQGFQAGNKCAGDGSKSKGKGEGKKEDVHSDWTSSNSASWDRSYEKLTGSYEQDFSLSDGSKVNVQMTPLGFHDSEGKFWDASFYVNDSLYQHLSPESSRAKAMELMRGVTQKISSFVQRDHVEKVKWTAMQDDAQRSRDKMFNYLGKKLASKIPGVKYEKLGLVGTLYKPKLSKPSGESEPEQTPWEEFGLSNPEDE